MPELPTLAEQGGDPGLVTYFAIFAPAGTPKPILNWLNSEFAKAIQSPRGQQLYKTYTLDPTPNTVEQFTAFVKADRDNAARVFQRIGIKPTAAPQ